MTVDEFRTSFRREISKTVSQVERRYSVTDEEFSSALLASAKKYLTNSDSRNPVILERVSRRAVREFIASINQDDLCLALACARGDESAWEDFFREYRGYLIGIARTMTQEAGAAEQLADSTFAELYGLRESDGVRVSKFSFYSGRGSLRGWLRAVVFQLSADLHRQSNRYVQTEEPEDLEKLARMAAPPPEGDSAEISFVRDRYRTAVAAALKSAILSLEPRERLLLAHYYYDEMTLREIGRIFEVHEATVSRWLAKVQKRTRKLIEKVLARDHEFNRRQISEAMQLASEQRDISVKEYLFESAAGDLEHERAANRAGGAVARR